MQRKCMCIKSARTDGGSKTLLHVFDRFEDTDLITELLEGMYTELHEKKPKKAKLGKQAINFYEMKPIKFVRIL